MIAVVRQAAIEPSGPQVRRFGHATRFRTNVHAADVEVLAA
jgi:hypothetical protein